jgi:prefoldin subunit 5
MSAALSSARRRRAGPEAVIPGPVVRQTTPQPSFPGSQSQQAQSSMGVGLTLPQVIALVDKRLNSLESYVQTQTQNEIAQPNQSDIDARLTPIIEEYNARFDIIADELASLKDTIMKLQTYTMEVNKTLMGERIRILSEPEEPTSLEKALQELNNL